jgi:hypothetical protein
VTSEEPVRVIPVVFQPSPERVPLVERFRRMMTMIAITIFLPRRLGEGRALANGGRKEDFWDLVWVVLAATTAAFACGKRSSLGCILSNINGMIVEMRRRSRQDGLDSIRGGIDRCRR